VYLKAADRADSRSRFERLFVRSSYLIAMKGKSARLQWERVEAARRQARDELGAGVRPGPAYVPPRRNGGKSYVEPQSPPIRRPPDTVAVLTLGETAARLGLSRSELERMIAAGKVETLTAGLARMIPMTEVERLAKQASASRNARNRIRPG